MHMTEEITANELKARIKPHREDRQRVAA